MEWQWNLESEPAKWRGVVLDGENRVITLQLDFGRTEGETWRTV